MKPYIRSTVVACVVIFLAVVLVFVTGCASTGRVASADEQTHAYTQGMVCPKCETVWVTQRKGHGPRSVTRLSHARATACPECDAMAQSRLLEDGSTLLHRCPTCKVTPQPIEPQNLDSYSEPSG
jgi:hypothetical protein